MRRRLACPASSAAGCSAAIDLEFGITGNCRDPEWSFGAPTYSLMRHFCSSESACRLPGMVITACNSNCNLNCNFVITGNCRIPGWYIFPSSFGMGLSRFELRPEPSLIRPSCLSLVPDKYAPPARACDLAGIPRWSGSRHQTEKQRISPPSFGFHFHAASLSDIIHLSLHDLRR